MRVKLGAIVTEASGRLGGQFISSDRSGASLRTINAKKQKTSTVAQPMRSLISSVSQKWRSLSADQQKAWNSFAAFLNLKGSFGDLKSLTGCQAFIKLNTMCWKEGDSILLSPASFLSPIATVPTGFSLSVVPATVSRWDFVKGGLFMGFLPYDDPLYVAGANIGMILLQDVIPDFYTWCNNVTEMCGAQAWSIGGSVANTLAMFSVFGNQSPAASFVVSLTRNGYSDWVIPSVPAMDLIDSDHRPELFNYARLFWTSFEVNEELAMFYNPNNNTPVNYQKNGYEYLCPVRFDSFPDVKLFSILLSSNLVAGMRLKVSATPPLSLGISNPRSNFRNLGVFETSEDSKVDISDAYISQFGSLPASGSKIFVKCRTFDSVTKQYSAEYIFSRVIS